MEDIFGGNKMIGIVIATHAGLGQGLIDAVSLIAGTPPNMKAFGLYHGDSPDQYEADIMAALEELDEGQGVLGFVDFLGGTPANTMMKCMAKKEFPCVAGVNMPMVLNAYMERDMAGSVDELMESCIEAGKQSFVKVHEMYQEMMADDDEEDEI